MAGIQLYQPDGVGTLNAAGAPHPPPVSVDVNKLCYLSFVGSPVPVSYSWAISTPAGSHTVISSKTSPSPTVVIDLASAAYSITLTDENLNVYQLDITSPATPSVANIDGSAGVFFASWYGVKADARQITDGVTTAGSAVLSSATAAFTAADIGKSVLLRAANQLATGTLAFTNLSTDVVGTGVNLPVDLPIIPGGTGTGQPSSGGGIYAVGVGYIAAQYSTGSGGHIVLAQPATQTISGCVWYKEAHIATTIVGVTSATQCVLATTATISETSVRATISTDDSTSLETAINAAFAARAGVLMLPAGLIGMSRNLVFSNKTGLDIVFTGPGIVELRKQSDQVAYPNTAHSYGILSFYQCTRVHLYGGSFDANLSCFGIVHSAGSSSNNSGSRSGFYMEACTECSYTRMRSTNLGARDEHLHVTGDSPDFTFDSCHVVGNNNVSINCNGGYVVPPVVACKGLRIINCVATGYEFSAGSFEVTNCHCTTGNVKGMLGGMTIDLLGTGVVNGFTAYDIDNSTNGVGIIDLFGNNDADANIVLANITIKDVTGAWHTGGGAAIHMNNYGGQARLSDINVVRATGSGINGRFVYIEGSSTGKVHLESGSFDGDSNISQGVVVASGVPSGAVTFGRNLQFGSNVTSRYVASNTGGFGRTDETQTISSTGAAATTNIGVEFVLVTANGAVGVTLPDPTKCRGRAVMVKNDTTQTGTTTIGTAAGNIDGSATLARTGASRSATFRSDGSNWKVEALYL